MQKSVIGWIARAAMNVERSLPGALYISRDDLIGYGAIGLCEARERFREGGGAQFKTFAWRRVRGSIVDGVRSEYRHGAKVTGALRANGIMPASDDGVDPLEHLLRRERRDLVRAERCAHETAARARLASEDFAARAGEIAEAAVAIPVGLAFYLLDPVRGAGPDLAALLRQLVTDLRSDR